MMKYHETLTAIREQVAPPTHEWLCGVSESIESELVAIANRDGIDAAVVEAEAMTPDEFREATQ
jgi:hypothetical protein